MKTMLAEQDTALRESTWIDKEQQVVRIPIDRAMQLVVDRGLPDWPRAEVDAKSPGEKSPGEKSSSETPTKQGAQSKRDPTEDQR
jgi:hypothetical protein